MLMVNLSLILMFLNFKLLVKMELKKKEREMLKDSERKWINL